jgi:dihydrofolate reductase
MMVSVFVGTSVDGFIARPNGDLDFLPPGGGEPHGYNKFIATVDAIVIGRKTFETVLAMEGWPYGDKRVVVLSSRPLDLSGAGGIVEQMAGSPAEIASRLAASGAHHLYVDGGVTIQGSRTTSYNCSRGFVRSRLYTQRPRSRDAAYGTAGVRFSPRLGDHQRVRRSRRIRLPPSLGDSSNTSPYRVVP